MYRNRLIKTPAIKLLKFSFIQGLSFSYFGFIPYLIKVLPFLNSNDLSDITIQPTFLIEN
ncbi:hypothetical protein BpHYR1_033869 [Brachionus plicatilis]|uniref:Uncharacterized protein n=1 Tax=Brachionus plicatilis TaxID=10195 RepID=A0A3M7RV07_BRAPC|nr:hypothetical protein BpHYR1_033869 [Brachionus plicatilis]